MPSVCLSENSFGFILSALVLTILRIPISANKDHRPLEAVVFLVALVVLGTPGGLSALAVHDRAANRDKIHTLVLHHVLRELCERLCVTGCGAVGTPGTEKGHGLCSRHLAPLLLAVPW